MTVGDTEVQNTLQPTSATKLPPALFTTSTPNPRLPLLQPKLGKTPRISIFFTLQSDFLHSKTRSQSEIGI